MMIRLRSLPVLLLVLFIALAVRAVPAAATEGAAPLVIGETFTLSSEALGETRRINVYRPPGATEATPLPVLVMPDGGMAEDFLHVAGLVQVSVGNGTMRPFLLVGIENTERRRDMTHPTQNEEDKKIAPRVGGSAAFRGFLRSELLPAIRARYRTTEETAIVGESLAGLFVVETFLREPDLFDTYIAFDPSLWWNDRQLVKDAETQGLLRVSARPKVLYLATSSQAEIAEITRHFAGLFNPQTAPRVTLHFNPMPGETHQTIYHPAALLAFRTVFKP